MLPDLVRNALAPLLIAVGLAVAMAFLDPAARSTAERLSWPAPDPGAYDVLLQAVAGVTGVFLALYFTAVSTVAASVYVNVPHDIRSLIVRDRVGGIYVTGTAFTTALSVTLLIAHTLTSATYELAPPIIGIFTAFSIFAFIRLGQRAFYLADPTRLGGAIVSEFFVWFQRATPQGWRWRDAAFQEHYRARAVQAVTSLKSLIAIADDQPHLRGSSVRQLCSQVSTMLTTYLQHRDRVPTSSRWFGQRYEHKEWYLADSTELDMATATATQLQPKVVPHVDWVESNLLPALESVVRSAVENKDLEEAFHVLSRLDPVLAGMSRRLEVRSATAHINDLTNSILEGFSQQSDARELARTVGAVALFDALAMLPLAVELGLHRYLTESPAPQDRIPRVEVLERAELPYQCDLPRPVVETIEAMQAATKFERAVRAPAVSQTPNWYVNEIVKNSYETRLKDQVTATIDLLTSWFPQTASRLTDAGLSGPHAAVIVRGLETCWKLEGHLQHWQAIVSAIRPEPTRVDVVRPRWEWEALERGVAELRRDLLHRLTTVVSMHGLEAHDSSLPDYMGGAIHWMGETCMEALIENDDELFADLFPTYFVGLLLVVNGIQGQILNWHPSIAVTAVAEPVMDLLELSGFAYVFSEMHGNPHLWNACRSPWEAYLSDTAGANRLKLIANMHQHQRNLFAITSRALVRTRWEMAANRALSAVRRTEPRSWHDDGEVEHSSRLIRRIAPRPGDLGSPFHASDIFAVSYLAQRSEAEALDFGIPEWIFRELADDAEPGDSDSHDEGTTT